ncbi:MAG: hypothetical protein KDE27_19675 [Planctomycetes bacterium]|nr:hypothetical protein [Planctomycetota bacterium]
MRALLSSLVLLGLVATASGQGVNCTLLGTFPPYSNDPFVGLWGYAAPNGDEYALIGTTAGTIVVDVSNPTNPIQRKWLPWGFASTRDIRTYSHFAYVVTGANAGFQILDLGDPGNPVALGVFGATHSSSARNVCVDVAAGRLYLVGCDTGTLVYDLTQNPANPTFLGYALPGGNVNYVNDLCVQNGYAYGAMLATNMLRIVDASAPLPWIALSNTSMPAAYTCWPNAAGTLCVATSGINGGGVRLFDISNKSSPQPLGQFSPNLSSRPSDAYLVGGFCHAIWDNLGYRCLDVRNPNNPVEVASFNTSSSACHPLLPSGNVLVAARLAGLDVIRPHIPDMQIAHASLGHTDDEDGPYEVTATVTSSVPVTSMTVYWRVGGTGTFNPVAMTPTGQPNEFGAAIPGHDAIATIEYYLEGTNSGGTWRQPVSGQYAFDIAGIRTLFHDGFETDLGWIHTAVLGADEWQRGAPTGANGTSGGVPWQDPPAAYAGSNVYGTDLGGPGFDGAYENLSLTYLISPAIAIRSGRAERLRFRRWLQVAPGDYALVYVNGLAVFSGQNIRDQSWQQVDIDISGLDLTGSMDVGFRLIANGVGQSGGWNIDELEVLGRSECAPPKLYGVGTAGGSGVPDITLAAPAAIGTTTDIEGRSIAPNAPTFTVLNFAVANQSAFGITTLVAVPWAVWFGTASVQGEIAVPFTVPNNAALDNVYVYAQMIPVDPAGPQGLAASRGLRFRVCPQ